MGNQGEALKLGGHGHSLSKGSLRLYPGSELINGKCPATSTAGHPGSVRGLAGVISARSGPRSGPAPLVFHRPVALFVHPLGLEPRTH